MSNVKQIEIEGLIPFDAGENDELLRKLGQISLLTSMSFNLREGDKVPNKHGGVTTRYNFSLVGVEALSFKWIDHFCDLVHEVGGSITSDCVEDLEV